MTTYLLHQPDIKIHATNQADDAPNVKENLIIAK
jgi:hypothetical protein